MDGNPLFFFRATWLVVLLSPVGWYVIFFILLLEAGLAVVAYLRAPFSLQWGEFW